MNDNMRRAFFYGMGAVYLIYLAYKMLTENSAEVGFDATLMIVVAVVFAIAGIGLLIFAIRIAKKDADEEKKNDTDESETD